MTGWAKHFQNPYLPYTRNYLSHILKDKYPQYNEMVERMAKSFANEQEAQMFCQMAIDLFEAGFLLSVDQHREILEKRGLKVSVTSKPPTPEPSIFKNKADNQK
jgi:hypothetical protein